MKNLNFIYQPGTQTVRTYPENYCVTAIRYFTEGGQLDGAVKDPEYIGRLFAAAPDLLFACERVYMHLVEGDLKNETLLKYLTYVIAEIKGIKP